MPSDKHATAMAVILLVFPDFIFPLEVERFCRPAEFFTLMPVPTTKSLSSTDEP
jgi:hypothetical protein